MGIGVEADIGEWMIVPGQGSERVITISSVPFGLSYSWSNVNKMVDSALFPGIVIRSFGTMGKLRLPVASEPVQNRFTR